MSAKNGAPRVRRRTRAQIPEDQKRVEASVPENAKVLTRKNKSWERVNEQLPKRVDRVRIPPPPQEEGDGPLRDEQQVARVEQLMLKGFTDPRQLGAMLNIDSRRMDRYIRRVHARWAQVGGKNDLSGHRGRALQRLNQIRSNLWVIFQNNEADPRAQVVVLNTLMDVEKHEAHLAGLTKEAIEGLNNRTNDNIVTTKMAEQAKLTQMAGELLEKLNMHVAKREGSGDGGEIMDPTDPDPFDLDDERRYLEGR